MRAIPIICFSLILNACATTQQAMPVSEISLQKNSLHHNKPSLHLISRNQTVGSSVEMSNPDEDNSGQDIEAMLGERFSRWQGVKYKLGGTDKNGIDCSAFVQSTYKRLFDIDIPRTTADQVHLGKKVTRNHLEIGDLVFFKTGRNQRHVGIYLGSDEFLHSSTSKGVAISSLNNSYWRSKYWKSLRIDDNLDRLAQKNMTNYMVASSKLSNTAKGEKSKQQSNLK